MKVLARLGTALFLAAIVVSPVTAQTTEWTRGVRSAYLGALNFEYCVSVTLVDGSYSIGDDFRLELLPSGYFSVFNNLDGDAVSRVGEWISQETVSGIEHIVMAEFSSPERTVKTLVWMGFSRTRRRSAYYFSKRSSKGPFVCISKA